MQFRPATLVVVACVAALFGFAGAASRTCLPVEGATAIGHNPSGAVAANAVTPTLAPARALQQ
jgi:hypothetical protein